LGTYHPLSFLSAGIRHRALIARLAQRHIAGRYRGSMLGGLWVVLHPVMMLCVYTFVFSTVFRAKWDLQAQSQIDFALFLFSGIVIYSVFSECVNHAPRLMLDNRTFIKQLDFPVEVFSWVSLTAALFNFLVSLAILIGVHLIVLGPPPLTSLWLPVVLSPVLLLSLGFSWLLASLGTFLRDLSEVTGIATTALLFLSPIFYPLSMIPEPFRRWYWLNPFTSVLESSKAVFFRAQLPDWGILCVIAAASWLVAWGGYVWFMKTKGAFADVL
jgi:lipopolysaccharide transport system permease protein